MVNLPYMKSVELLKFLHMSGYNISFIPRQHQENDGLSVEQFDSIFDHYDAVSAEHQFLCSQK